MAVTDNVPRRDERASPDPVQWLPLLVVLALAWVLRIVFYQGLVHYDGLVYSHLAERLAEGVSPFAKPLPDAWGAVRVGLYVPVALLYRLFGVSHATTVAWPLLCSLLGVAGAYALGKRLAGESAGLFAAFMLAVLPTNVAAGTALLGDGPVAACSIGIVLFLVRASESTGTRALWNAAASLALLGLGLLCKPIILLLLPFLIYFGLGAVNQRAVRGAGIALGVIGLIGYVVYIRAAPPPHLPTGVVHGFERLAGSAMDLWQRFVSTTPEFSWWAPLWLAAFAGSLALGRRETRVPLAWLGLTFAYGELGTRSLATYVPVVWYDNDSPARHMLFLAAPAIILTAVFIAPAVERRAARWIVMGASVVTALVAFLGTRGADNMTWGVTRMPVDALPFATLSGLAVIVVFFVGVMTPALLRVTSDRLRLGALAALMLSIGLASLSYSYRAANQFKPPSVETFPEALRFLATQPEMPIIVQNADFAERLDFYSGFRLGFRSTLRPFITKARIEKVPAKATAITDAYVLVDDYYVKVYEDLRPYIAEPWAPTYLRQIPANWVKIAEFGKYEGAHLKIYRVSRAAALAELAKVRAARQAEETPATLLAEMNAAMGAQEYCEGAAAWQRLRVVSPTSVAQFNPAALLQECAARQEDVRGANLFVNGDFANGRDHWDTNAGAKARVGIETVDGRTAFHVTWEGGDWRVIDQAQTLQPDTAYLYEMDIKTTAPVIPMYWQSDTGRYADGETTYREWTHVLYAFVTPKWTGQPMSANFNPVLMKGPGEVWLANVRVTPLTIPLK